MPYDTYEEEKPAPDLSYLSAQPPVATKPVDPTYARWARLGILPSSEMPQRSNEKFDPSLAGMPISLARRAQQNLDTVNAKEQAMLDRHPEWGQQDARDPRGVIISDPTPVPSATTTAPSNQDSHKSEPSDPAIATFRARRDQLLQGIDPENPAIYPNDKRRAQMHQELYHVTGALHQLTLDAAHQAHSNYLQQRDIESADQFTGLVNGLANMKSQPGTPEHAQELLGLIQQYPLGAQSKAALALLKTHATTHAEHKTLQESMQDYREATGLEPDSIETTATGGFNLRGKTSEARAPETEEIPSHTLDRYAKLQGEIAQHEAASDAEAKANTKAKMPDTPYSGSAKWAAAQKEIAILEKAHPVLKGAVSTATTTAPDLKALAQKALSDPNASPEHKAAAKKILGQ